MVVYLSNEYAVKSPKERDSARETTHCIHHYTKNADPVVSYDALLRDAFTCDMMMQLAEWLATASS